MQNLKHLLNRNPLFCVARQRMLNGRDLDSRSQALAPNVNGRFKQESLLFVVSDIGAEPAEEWSHGWPGVALKRFEIAVEILFLQRNPNSPAKYFRAANDGNFNDAPDKKVASIDDAGIRADLATRLPFTFGHRQVMVREIRPDVWNRVVRLTAHGALKFHIFLIGKLGREDSDIQFLAVARRDHSHRTGSLGQGNTFLLDESAGVDHMHHSGGL